MSRPDKISVVVIPPLLPVANELVQFMRSEPSCEVIEADKADIVYTILQRQPCILVASIEDNQGLIDIIALLKRINLKQNRGSIKSIIVGKRSFARLSEAMRSLYVSDFVIETVPARTLIFKGKLQLNTLKAGVAAARPSSKLNEGGADEEKAEDAAAESDVFVFSRKKTRQVKEKFVLKKTENESDEEASDFATSAEAAAETTGKFLGADPARDSGPSVRLAQADGPGAGDESAPRLMGQAAPAQTEAEASQRLGNGLQSAADKADSFSADKRPATPEESAAKRNDFAEEAVRAGSSRAQGESPGPSEASGPALRGAGAETPSDDAGGPLRAASGIGPGTGQLPEKTLGELAMARLALIAKKSEDRKRESEDQAKENAAKRLEKERVRAASTASELAQRLQELHELQELQNEREASPVGEKAQPPGKSSSLEGVEPASRSARAEASPSLSDAKEDQGSAARAEEKPVRDTGGAADSAPLEPERAARASRSDEDASAEKAEREASATSEAPLTEREEAKDETASSRIEALAAAKAQKAGAQDPADALAAESAEQAKRRKLAAEADAARRARVLESLGKESKRDALASDDDRPEKSEKEEADAEPDPSAKEEKPQREVADSQEAAGEESTWSSLQAPGSAEPASARHAHDSADEDEEVKWQAKNEVMPASAEKRFFYRGRAEVSALPGKWVKTKAGYFFLRDGIVKNGLRVVQEALPLWIYLGEEAPKLLIATARWRFSDIDAEMAVSTDALPAAILAALSEFLPKAPGTESQQSRALRDFFDSKGKTDSSTEKERAAAPGDSSHDASPAEGAAAATGEAESLAAAHRQEPDTPQGSPERTAALEAENGTDAVPLGEDATGSGRAKIRLDEIVAAPADGEGESKAGNPDAEPAGMLDGLRKIAAGLKGLRKTDREVTDEELVVTREEKSAKGKLDELDAGAQPKRTLGREESSALAPAAHEPTSEADSLARRASDLASGLARPASRKADRADDGAVRAAASVSPDAGAAKPAVPSADASERKRPAARAAASPERPPLAPFALNPGVAFPETVGGSVVGKPRAAEPAADPNIPRPAAVMAMATAPQSPVGGAVTEPPPLASAASLGVSQSGAALAATATPVPSLSDVFGSGARAEAGALVGPAVALEPSASRATQLAWAVAQAAKERGKEGKNPGQFRSLALELALVQVSRRNLDSARAAKVILDFGAASLPTCRLFVLERLGDDFYWRSGSDGASQQAVPAAHLDCLARSERGAARQVQASDKTFWVWIEFPPEGRLAMEHRRAIDKIGQNYVFLGLSAPQSPRLKLVEPPRNSL